MEEAVAAVMSKRESEKEKNGIIIGPAAVHFFSSVVCCFTLGNLRIEPLAKNSLVFV